MPEPELSERVNRCEKVKILRQKGVNPYPAESQRTHTIREVVDLFENLQESKTVLTIAGRVMAKREHGGSTFVDIHDGADYIQCYFKKDALSSKNVLPNPLFIRFLCFSFSPFATTPIIQSPSFQPKVPPVLVPCLSPSSPCQADTRTYVIFF